MGDKAYDSDSLDEALAQQGIQMRAPHRELRNLPSRGQAVEAVSKTLEGRKAFCLAAKLSPLGGAL
jgi:hypothetical protein